jgi:hypothetical protein
MSEIFLHVNSASASVRCSDKRLAGVLEDLRRDFQFFLGPQAKCPVEIEICPRTPAQAESRPPLFYRGRVARVHGWFDHRVCDYYDGSFAESRTHGGVRRFWISGPNANSVREIAYCILLSAMGEELDRLGLHRAHALGFEDAGRRFLLTAPSGAGKSSLARLMSRVRLFSDESPLLKGNEIHPFPLRLAVAPSVAAALGFGEGELFIRQSFGAKVLHPFPARRLAESGPVDVIMIGRPGARAPRIVPRSRLTVSVDLFGAVVVGLGLAQMSEWMLRLSALPRLISIACRRFLTMAKLLADARQVYEFQLCSDARRNSECLEQFLREAGHEVAECVPSL